MFHQIALPTPCLVQNPPLLLFCELPDPWPHYSQGRHKSNVYGSRHFPLYEAVQDFPPETGAFPFQKRAPAACLPFGSSYHETQNLLEEVRGPVFQIRSEEHTSELQSRGHLVCRLLLEKI